MWYVGAGHVIQIDKESITSGAERTNPERELKKDYIQYLIPIPGTVFYGVDRQLEMLVSAPEVLVSDVGEGELLLPAVQS